MLVVKGVIYQESLRRFVIEIEETDQLWSHERCPRDGGDVRLYDHAPSRQWRHLNVFNHECVLQCALPRGKCLDSCPASYTRGSGRALDEEQTRHIAPSDSGQRSLKSFALTLCREIVQGEKPGL